MADWEKVRTLTEDVKAMEKRVENYSYEDRHASIVTDEKVCDLVVRGIRAVFDGELWLSREVLADLVMRGSVETDADRTDAKLTKREREILDHVRTGRTNDEIGAELSISTKAVSSLAFSTDGQLLAVGGADRKIRIWEIGSV